jgi:DNA adenine methylase
MSEGALGRQPWPRPLLSARSAAIDSGVAPAIADKATRARPFIKWAGGKTRLLPLLLPHVPESFQRYHEPFLGGGALLFAVGERGELAPRACDLNGELVNAWQVVRDQPDRLHRRLAAYAEKDSKEFFYAVRGESCAEPVDRAAHFVYLNKTAWNGLYRVNGLGEFNVPWGARAFSLPDLDALEAVARALEGTAIEQADFRAALGRAEGGDFVYLDPPYLKISDTSKFNGYTQRRFRKDDLAELAELLAELTDRGVRWLLSNRDSPEIRGLFPGCEVVRLTVRRSVAAQNRRDVEPAKSPEVIISNRLALP